MDLHFGDHRLNMHERQVVGPAGAVELSSRAFDLLRAFLERPGELLDKDALFAAAWPGLIVEDNTLQVHISALRKALGQGLIATVHGRGYRYVGPPPVPAEPVIAAAAAPPQGLTGNIARYAADCIARDTEAAAIRTLLASHRLVSLVGPGGVGKTTLAVAIAAEQPPAGGAWMIDLASLDNGAFIESTLIQTLGVPFRAGSVARDSIVAHLRRAPALLVFDNCEHLRAEAANICHGLLAEVPELRILATSQVPLGLQEERVFKLAPFAVADGAVDGTSEAFLAYCIELFGDAVTPAERPLLASLSRRLDGLALALKMAAARAATIGLAAVDRQLGEQLAGLDAAWDPALPRHRSLAASLAWSYDLLSPDEQRTLRALGVFNGSFSLVAAIAVAGAGAEARVAELVRRSLVVRDSTDRTRHRLLDSTRRFALDRLAEAGEEAAARDRHADYVTALFNESCTRWEEMPDDAWEALYLPEGDNLRTALAWTRSRSDKAGFVALAGVTARYFTQAQLGADALATMEGAAPFAANSAPESAARHGLAFAESLRLNAMDIRGHDVLRPALEWFRQSDDIVRYRQALVLMTWVTLFFRPTDDVEELVTELRGVLPSMPVSKSKAWGLVATGCFMWGQGEREAGIARCRAGLAMHAEAGNYHGAFRSVMNFGEVLHRGGDSAGALALAEDYLDDIRLRGSRLQLANHLSNIAAYRFWLGDNAGAIAAHAESAPLFPRDGSYWHMCFLQNGAEALYWRGDHKPAALILGLVDRYISQWPDGRQATEQMQRDRLANRLAEAMGPEAFNDLMRQGAILDVADAEQLLAAPGRAGQ